MKSNSSRPISRECATAPNLSSAASTAPLRALLCLFKYSRQCCWSVWERRAHGAALPLRSVKQPLLHVRQATETTGRPTACITSTLWPEGLTGASETKRGSKCGGADVDWWAYRAIDITPVFSERKLEVRSGLSAVPYSRLLNSTERQYGLMRLINVSYLRMRAQLKNSLTERVLLFIWLNDRGDETSQWPSSAEFRPVNIKPSAEADSCWR